MKIVLDLTLILMTLFILVWIPETALFLIAIAALVSIWIERKQEEKREEARRSRLCKLTEIL